MNRYNSLEEAERVSALLYAAKKNSVPTDQIILALVEQNEMLRAKIRDLDIISPKKVTGPDNTVWIYRCPDYLIP